MTKTGFAYYAAVPEIKVCSKTQTPAENGFRSVLPDKMQSLSDCNITALEPEDKLFSTGVIDSMTIVEIILLVEQYWNIEVDPTDLSMDNFDSVAAICRYVRQKRNGAD